MASTNIDDMFDENRFPSGCALLPFILYFPLGFVLAVLRIFIGLHTYIIACILPKMTNFRCAVLRFMCTVLGIWVKKDGAENRKPEVKMIVANYTSALDHLALELVLPNILPSVWDLPPLLMWILGYKEMGAKGGRDKLIQNSKKHCQESSIPLLAFPEGASTNGRKGLLKFSVWPFSLDHPVQPVILRLSRPPFARVAPSVLGGRWWLDVFWFLFVPYTYFHIKILPAMEENDDESPEEFTRRVQISMAEGLEIELTPHTSADKVEHAKRKLFIQTHSGQQPDASLNNSNSQDPLGQMCQQVKEVLPHVPIMSIRADLALTKDVDLTITNLLEGRVQYEAEQLGVDATSSPPISYSNNPFNITPSKHMTSTPEPSPKATFAKSPVDRQNTLTQRKQALLDQARLRYIQKNVKS